MRRSTACSVVLTALFALTAGCGSGSGGGNSSGPGDSAQSPVVGARALSNHYVEVQFDRAVPSQFLDPAAFEIKSAGGETLDVQSADLRRSGSSVLLTTASQADTAYSLQVAGSSQLWVLSGSDVGEPKLLMAVPLNNTTVLLTFDQNLDASSAQDDGNYSIKKTSGTGNANLAVSSAQLPQAPFTNVVTLTTAAQADREYEVTITVEAESQAGIPLDPQNNTATFNGFPSTDNVAPALLGAESISDTAVVLSFSEPVDPATIPDAATLSTSIAPALDVLATVPNPFNTQVLVSTTPQQRYVSYSIVLPDTVTDVAGNALDSDADSAIFVYNGPTPVVPFTQGDADNSIEPRILGALSSNNTTVELTYSVPMGGSAVDPGNYFIVAGDVNAEAGALIIEDARWGITGGIEDRRRVILTTRSQSTIEYFLAAIGVFDAVGRPVGPQQIFEGWLVLGAHTATFWGSGPNGPPIDTDGDGLPDNEEQFGWQVRVTLADVGPDGLERVTTRDVTSEPDNADTDGDGLDDAAEARLRTDPRDADTDDDEISDYDEVHLFYSNPIRQDTDRDGLTDYAEIMLFKSSPTLTDTDGDSFSDYREIIEMNRNPRLADLPIPSISITELNLRIDERYSYTDEEGHEVQNSVESSSTATLATSSSTRTGSSKTRSSEDLTSILGGAEFGFEGNPRCANIDVLPEDCLNQDSQPGGARGVIAVGHAERTDATTTTDTTEVTKESVREAQEAYETSVSKGRSSSQSATSTISREVVGAAIDAGVTIGNASNIAFTITDVEVSVLQHGRSGTSFVPVASLLPQREILGGTSPVFNIPPGGAELGPLVFSNREVFPNQVDSLLRQPRGLVVRLANYNVTDEFGRNLAFITQDVLDRTGSLVIDPGDGTTQRFFVATSGSFDDDGYFTVCDDNTTGGSAGNRCDSDANCPGGSCVSTLLGGFDADGKAIGLPLDYVLQDVLGLVKNPSANNAIVAGADGKVSTFAEGDDIQVVPIGTEGLLDRAIVILAGENGVLDTTENNVDSNGDDAPAKTIGYETTPTCNEDTTAQIVEPLSGGNGVADTAKAGDDVQLIAQGMLAAAGAVIVGPGNDGILQTVQNGDDEFSGPGNTCAQDSDCPSGSCSGREALLRFGNTIQGTPKRFWVVLTSDDVPIGTDFGAMRLKPGEAITLALGQDIDRDGLFAREEFLNGSSDRSKDTDRDELDDFVEIRSGWDVKVPGRDDLEVHPDPRLADTDADGVRDDSEQQCRTDPRLRDTDGDGLSDADELNCGECCESSTATEKCVARFATKTSQCTSSKVCCKSSDSTSCDYSHICTSDGECDSVFDSCTSGKVDTLVDSCEEVCPADGNFLQDIDNLRLDPRNPDSDGDSLPDGFEDAIDELDPLDPNDAGDFIDSDADGLGNVTESEGWNVAVQLCANICNSAFDGVCDDGTTCGRSCGGDAECPCGTDCADCTVARAAATQCIADCDDDCDDECGTDSACLALCKDDCRLHAPVVDVQQFSSLVDGDTDFDGLPDFVEHAIGSNPLSPDTDGDGLLDYDEFAAFGRFLTLNFEFPGFFLSDGGSQKLGTDPNSADTDGDGLPDADELTGGWRVIVFGEDLRVVYSDPRFADSDLDGLDDLHEYLGVDGIPPGEPSDSGDATDPTDPDTDGDQRPDGLEVESGTDPSHPDKSVTVNYLIFDLEKAPLGDDNGNCLDGFPPSLGFGPCDPFGAGVCEEKREQLCQNPQPYGCGGGGCDFSGPCSDDEAEMVWHLSVARPEDDRTLGTPVATSDPSTGPGKTDRGTCPESRAKYECPFCLLYKQQRLVLDKGITFPLLPNQVFRLIGKVQEQKGCKNSPTGVCGDMGNSNLCDIDFIETYGFDDIPATGVETKTIKLTDDKCDVSIVVEIVVN